MKSAFIKWCPLHILPIANAQFWKLERFWKIISIWLRWEGLEIFDKAQFYLEIRDIKAIIDKSDPLNMRKIYKWEKS